jgi:pantoate--beta-alanine ligase
VKTVRAKAELSEALEALRGTSEVGLVPTMGALHAGHVALFERAGSECDLVVASIFVNPAQFGPDEDLASYPRDEERDATVASKSGVDVVFVPDAEEMYPDGFATWVDVERAAEGLEGAARPGHFRGVATICLKLFNLVRPQRAYFGQKDAQQAAVVEQLVRDLDVAVDVRLVPTVRDLDGVAVSSRNSYLSPEERRAAAAIPRALFAGEDAHRQGANPVAVARTILAGEPGLEPEYVELARFDGRLHLLAAVRAGRTRLIDNVVLEGELA